MMSDDSPEQASECEDDSPETEEDFKKLISELFGRLSNLESVTSDYKRLMENLLVLQGKVEDVTDKLEKSETSLITVLGIFTAIVVTFVGTFAFSSSVFQNMDKGDIHRLIFVVLCIAVFIASILRWLFDFLLRICGKEAKFSKWWWVVIVIFFFVMSRVDWMNYNCNTLEKGILPNIENFFFFSEASCKSQDTQGQNTHTNNNKNKPSLSTVSATRSNLG